MLRSRLVPVLLANRTGLVKTTKFRSPVYVGDPINIIRIFNEKEADELALLDIDASSRGDGPNFDLVNDVAAECFMPLAYGGGIRDVEDAKRLYGLGVEKVVLRTAAWRDIHVLADIANCAGSQSVSVSIDLRRDRFHRLHLHAPGTPLHHCRDWERQVAAAAQAGAGEVILNCVHRDGAMTGMDLDAIAAAAHLADVPLLAVGGVGSIDDIRMGLQAGATAVGAGAFFVFRGPRRAVLVSYPDSSVVRSLSNRGDR